MEGKIKEYMEGLFADVPQTRKAYELKEEMIQNLIEKYRDLLAQGMPEEAAYNIAIAGIGDISDLVQELDGTTQYVYEAQKHRKKAAALTAIAVMMYILSVLPVLLLEMVHLETLGICIMFLIVAAATGIMVYVFKTKPQYQKREDTLVEDFKEWQSTKGNKKSLRKAINSVLWLLTVAVYMLVSFRTGAWHITWIIFLISTAIEQIIRACFDLTK